MFMHHYELVYLPRFPSSPQPRKTRALATSKSLMIPVLVVYPSKYRFQIAGINNRWFQFTILQKTCAQGCWGFTLFFSLLLLVGKSKTSLDPKMGYKNNIKQSPMTLAHFKRAKASF